MDSPFSSEAIKSVTAKLSESNKMGDLFRNFPCLEMLIKMALKIILKKQTKIITGHK